MSNSTGGDAWVHGDILKKSDTEVWRHKALFCPITISSYQASILIIPCPVAASSFSQCKPLSQLQNRKIIYMNQLDATMIYWSIRSAQHVSGNILPIIRMRETEIFTAYGILLLWWVGRRWAVALHYVQCYCSPSTYPPQQQDTICCKYLSLTHPDDGQNISRNMLSWSYRSINHCCI